MPHLIRLEKELSFAVGADATRICQQIMLAVMYAQRGDGIHVIFIGENHQRDGSRRVAIMQTLIALRLTEPLYIVERGMIDLRGTFSMMSHYVERDDQSIKSADPSRNSDAVEAACSGIRMRRRPMGHRPRGAVVVFFFGEDHEQPICRLMERMPESTLGGPRAAADGRPLLIRWHFFPAGERIAPPTAALTAGGWTVVGWTFRADPSVQTMMARTLAPGASLTISIVPVRSPGSLSQYCIVEIDATQAALITAIAGVVAVPGAAAATASYDVLVGAAGLAPHLMQMRPAA